jgi:hydrogenase 3 maturation protease
LKSITERKKTLPPSWQTLLNQNLRPNKADPLRVAIAGVGNEFNGDDAVGVILARTLLTCIPPAVVSTVLVLEAGPAPENITVDLRRFQPDVVILVDAAQMNLPPGSIEWLAWDSVTGMSAASHMLPLSMLARYLTLEFGCVVYLLGIQPAQNEPDTPLSLPAQAAVNEIVQAFCAALLQPMALF